MSNFLNQFEDYINDNVMKAEEHSESNAKISGLRPTEHEIVIDNNYSKHKIIRTAVVCITVLILFVSGIFLFAAMNKVQIPDFSGRTITEARTWAVKNSVELDEQYIFNTDIRTDFIVSQSIASGSKLSKGGTLALVISRGADPDEKIEVINFSDKTAAQIQNWIDTNKLINTRLLEVNSDTVPAGRFIRAEYRDIAVNQENFKRKDYLNIIVSKGPAASDSDVVIPSFVGKTTGEANSWADLNGITINYVHKISENVAVDKIISQSNTAGSIVQSGSSITLTVSAGPGIVVPDFSNVLMDDAPSLYPSFSVTVKMLYSSSKAYGKFISQSVEAGKRVLPTNNKIEVIYSAGKPYIDDLSGRSEKELDAYFYDFMLMGANITYTVTYIDDAAPKGTVVRTSKYCEYISLNEVITVYVSKGNLTSDNM